MSLRYEPASEHFHISVKSVAIVNDDIWPRVDYAVLNLREGGGGPGGNAKRPLTDPEISLKSP